MNDPSIGQLLTHHRPTSTLTTIVNSTFVELFARLRVGELPFFGFT